jgi:hypothetical protein
MKKLQNRALKWGILALLLCFHFSFLRAQDDLMDILEEMEEETIDYTFATFKGVRIINSHSIEMPGQGVLQMMISHRFGRINGGPYEFFGLDQANMRLGFEYGVRPWLTLGVGRSNVNKTYDGFTKIRLFRQKSGAENFPFTITALSAMQVNTLRWANPDRENYFTSRLSYSHQLLIARKFGEHLSLQLMPTMVHRNLVATRDAQNDVFAMGVGGRLRLSKSVTLNFEYFYQLPGNNAENFKNSLSFSFDIETGGHVFQLMFTNSLGMTENLYIAQTTGDWLAGDIHFGFNLGRVFTVQRP